jgi:hypothetical protein
VKAVFTAGTQRGRAATKKGTDNFTTTVPARISRNEEGKSTHHEGHEDHEG